MKSLAGESYLSCALIGFLHYPTKSEPNFARAESRNAPSIESLLTPSFSRVSITFSCFAENFEKS